MTQPPPPPHQPPPGGGFGPPEDPPPQPPSAPQGGTPDLGKGPQPQPGHGHPQAPPAGPPAPPPGAPQPGYGYPQEPQPPQPGYGYPGQAQPGPYGQQPGPYGQPQQPYGQQPGPYGQPQQPYGQTQQPYGQQQPGPYGQPQQPYGPGTVPMPAQPGGPGGRKKVNSQVAIIVAAVAAIALIIGAGVWYAGSGKDDDKQTTADGGKGGKGKEGAEQDGADKEGSGAGETGGKGGDGGASPGGSREKAPGDPASRVLFQVPQPAVGKDDRSVVVAGSWLTDSVYAKSGIAEIVGYDPVKGGKLWTIKLDGPVCAASRHVTADGRTVIAHQPAMPTKAEPSHGCTQVAVIDLAAGKKVWTKTGTAGDRPISFNNVTLSGETVAAGSTEGGVAFDLADGTVRWSPKRTDSCYDAGYGGGPKLVAVRKCGSYGARQLNIQTIDPKTGKVLSEYRMAKGIEYAGVVSTDPLVVAADVGDSAKDGSGISDFFSIDNSTGELRTRISAPGKQFAASCDSITKPEQCQGLAVGNDRLYIPTEEHEGGGEGYSRTNEVVAFDLGTGRQTGQRADAGENYRITPLRMDGGNVIAYKRPPYDKGGQVVSIDGQTFKQTVLLENPAAEGVRDAEARMSPQYSEIIYSQGRLYMSQVFASELISKNRKEYLVIAFGRGD
ncbi:PQQ-binding-like beta-propeller repeat protein [Streptomyces sp. NPDC052077]|uniref:outer membrane protein assembly factor BamB family protein n=1 Tax=Streptomyces sp. NPDC052077 TaxID=3154757 RepID=UPI003424D924